MITLQQQDVADEYLCEDSVDGARVVFYRHAVEPEHTIYHATVEYSHHSQEAQRAARRFHSALRDTLVRQIKQSRMPEKPDRFIYPLKTSEQGGYGEFIFVVPNDLTSQTAYEPNLMVSAMAAYDQMKAQSNGR